MNDPWKTFKDQFEIANKQFKDITKEQENQVPCRDDLVLLYVLVSNLQYSLGRAIGFF